MKTEEIEQIIQLAPEHLKERMGELEDKIMEAAREALEASQDSEGGGKPTVSVNLKVKINLTKSPVSFLTTGSVSVAYKSEGDEVMLEDESQPSLFPKS